MVLLAEEDRVETDRPPQEAMVAVEQSVLFGREMFVSSPQQIQEMYK